MDYDNYLNSDWDDGDIDSTFIDNDFSYTAPNEEEQGAYRPNDTGSFGCGVTGTAYVTLDWVDADGHPAPNPPPKVLVMKKIAAKDTSNSLNDTIYQDTASNGVDPSIHHDLSEWTWYDTSGTDGSGLYDTTYYSVHDSSSGHVEIAPQTLSASIDCGRDSTNLDLSYAWASIGIKIVPSSLSLDISGGLDNTANVSALVGEKVSATFNTDNYQVQPTDTFSWTITGARPFDDFITSDTSGIYYALWARYPNNTQSVACYFAKPDLAILTCHATLAGQSVTLDAKTTIEAPAVAFGFSIGTVLDLPQPNPTYVQLVEVNYQAGTGDANGADWDRISVTTPEDYYEHTSDAGSWAWHQLWKPYRPITFWDGWTEPIQTSTPPEIPLTGQEVADTGYPYRHESYTADGSPGGDADSPIDTLPPADIVASTSVNESFRDFLMYVPPGWDSVAVPLKGINWFWKFDASSNGSVWTVTNKNADRSDPFAFPDFPQWTSYVAQSSMYYNGF